MRLLETSEMRGRKGTYRMNIYPADMRFNDFIPGVFLLLAGDRTLYIGESDNVDLFLQDNQVHEKLSLVGFDRIGFIRNGSPEVRAKILNDLTSLHKPEREHL